MEVVNDTPKLVWVPVGVSETLYVGQIVKCINEGAYGIDGAVGANDFTHRQTAAGIDADGTSSSINNTPYGVVVGTNNKTPLFNTVAATEYITYASPFAAGTDTYTSPGGPWVAGDTVAMVKVALITPETVLRASLFNSTALRTAMTVGTVTASSSALTATTATVGAPGVASHSTVYFRTGAAAGQYRVTDDTSATVHAWDMPLSLASSGTSLVGDTLVKANLRPNGFSRMQVSTYGTWADSNASSTLNYFIVNVHKLDLSVAGQEYVEFNFDPNALSVLGTS